MTTCSCRVALVAALVALPALAAEPELELFVDRSDTFVRAGTDSGLQVGQSLTVLGAKIGNTKERRRVGTATVMETWASLARVSLDEAAKADKAPSKAVVVPGAHAAAAAAVPGKPTAPPGPPPTPPPASADRSAIAAAEAAAAERAGAHGGALKGHATFKGAGPWKLLQLYNDSQVAWTRCQLVLQPGNLHYTLPKLKGDDHEAIALSNFKQVGPERDVEMTSVLVTCAEGQATLKFPD